MLKKAIVTLALIGATAGQAQAFWSKEPPSINECVVKEMRKQSDSKMRATVRDACREKFDAWIDKHPEWKQEHKCVSLNDFNAGQNHWNLPICR